MTTAINSITFVLPGLPPSCNQLMAYRPVHVGGKIRIETKTRDDVYRWRSKMFQYIPPLKVNDGAFYRLDWVISYDWNYKNGNFKRIDSSNFQKALHDLVSKKLGFDDSRIKAGSFNTINSKVEQVQVTLTELFTRGEKEEL